MVSDPGLLPRRNERIFRMGGRIGCGFTYQENGHHCDWRSGRRILDSSYIIVYLFAGKGRYQDENGNACELSPGCLYQRFPGVGHRNWFEPEEAFGECYLVFPREFFDLLLATQQISLSEPAMQVGLEAAFLRGFEGIYERMRDCAEWQLHEVLAQMHAFAAALLARGRQGAGGGGAQWQPLLKALEEDIGCRRPLEDFARELGVSYSGFRQRFSAAFGIGPGEYRQKKRMELAQQLLLRPQAAIKDVASALGYPDVYSFSRQFKKTVELNPGQFVRLHR